MIGKMQSMALSVMAFVAMMPIAAYADTQQYPGLEIFPIEVATDGVIDSPSEMQTARLLSDVILHTNDMDELMSSPGMAEFWEDIQAPLVDSISDVPGVMFKIGLAESERQNVDAIKQLIDKHYPDAQYEIKVSYYEYPGDAIADDHWYDSLTSDDDSEPARGTVGRSFVKNPDVLNKPIPDSSRRLVEMDTYEFAGGPIAITDIKVTITIDHEDHDELNGYLKFTDGSIVKLFARERGISDGKYTRTLTDAGALSSLVGKEIQSPIKLMIGDYRGGDIGKPVSWNLMIAGTQHTDHIDPPAGGLLYSWLPDFIKKFFNDTSCSDSTDNCMPQQAGMMYSVLRNGETRVGTVSLGGVEKTNDKQGFLIPGHSLNSGITEQIVYPTHLKTLQYIKNDAILTNAR